jgi:hypothetical protein
VLLHLEEREYEILLKKKGKRTWKEFLVGDKLRSHKKVAKKVIEKVEEEKEEALG